MAFGSQWDSKTRRYAPHTRGQRFPAWMYDLGKQLASNGSDYTSVYPHGSNFAPDVALVNFYPVSYLINSDHTCILCGKIASSKTT